jgi:murein DD-endopeptidase MepM/ murein hydrolase activator NlpD
MRINMRRLIVFSFLILPGLAQAASFFLELEGTLIQGAMVQGRTNAQKVEVLGREFSPLDGRFVFGLGRDTPEAITIRATFSGESINYNFSVEQRQYRTQSIEGVEKKYVNPPESVLARIRSDAAAIKKARAMISASDDFRGKWLWPADGPISGVYGSQRIFNGVPKRPHYGLDIAGPVGAPIRSPISGIVRLAHADMYYSGGTLVVDHGQGISSTFIHLSKILVKEGQKIQSGELIAEMGATGRVTGPHLDWRVNWFEQRLDPLLLLPPREN